MKNLRLAVRSGLVAGLALVGTAIAQTTTAQKDSAAPPATDLERVRAGVEAPDFTLEDQDGKQVRLSGYRGNKTVVLVFYRGYW